MPTNIILRYTEILVLLIAIVFILFHLKKFSKLHVRLEERRSQRDRNATVS